MGSSDAQEITVPVWFVIGRSGLVSSRNALSDILSGADGIKAILDGAQTFGDVRVTGAVHREITLAGVPYLAARFDVEVYG